jgi:hypothetical protein
MGLGSFIFSQALEAGRMSAEAMGLLQDVIHEAYASQDATGGRSYADPVPRHAMVQEGTRQMMSDKGVMVNVNAIITFYPEADGEDPPAIGEHDKLTLPSGRTGPILQIKPTVIGMSGGPFVRTVWL